MNFRLSLTLNNPTSAAVTTVIAGGTVFEVLDPFSGVQNLAAASTTRMTVPAGHTKVVTINTWCLNQPSRPPANTPMRATRFSLASEFHTQGDVWTDLAGRS